MKVVIDTNVLVSGIFFGGVPYRILKAWRNEHFVLVASNEIIDEYERVIHEVSCKKPPFNPDAIIELIRKNVHLTKPVCLHSQVCTDPDDDKFIACALAAKATIITGDKALLRTNGYKDLIVITPAAFQHQYC